MKSPIVTVKRLREVVAGLPDDMVVSARSDGGCQHVASAAFSVRVEGKTLVVGTALPMPEGDECGCEPGEYRSEHRRVRK